MKSATRPASGSFRMRHLAVLTATPVLALALLSPSSAEAALRSREHRGDIVRPWSSPSKLAETTQPVRIELAGRKSGDESFDPYGKDDPTSKKWGAAAGLLGNRYGGMRTGGGDSKNSEKKEGRNLDRDDREPRAPRGDKSGRN